MRKDRPCKCNRLLTPTVGVDNCQKVAIATDPVSVKATNKLLPPMRLFAAQVS